MKPVLLILLATLLLACNRQGPTAPAAEPAIKGERIQFPADSPQRKSLVTEAVESGKDDLLKLNGRLTWDESRTVRIYSPLAGRIAQLLAQPGQKVPAGAPLAAVASPEFGQTQAEAVRADADFALAEKSFGRARDLFSHGVIAEKDLQAAQADFERSRAERARTAARATLYGGGSVDQRFILRSPIAGVVVERNANPGQEVRPDQAQPGNPPLFVVSDPSRLWIQLELGEAAVGAVRPGMIFHVHSAVLGEQTIEGKIEWIADGLDPNTRTVRARASVPNQERRLKAEMFVSAEIDQPAQALRIASAAVMLLGSTQFVFVDEGGGAFSRRKVDAVEAGFGYMRVRDGLRPGERVVTDGVLLLQQLLSTAGK